MPLHAPSINTWAAAPLDPDGEYGSLSPGRLVVGLLSAVLAGAGLLLLLVDGDYRWGSCLLAAAVVVAAARAAATACKSLLGSHVLVRVMVLLGAGAAYDARRPAEAPVVWTLVSVLLLAVLGEPLLRRILGGRRFVAAHLVGLPDVPTERLPTVAVPLTSVVVTVAGLALGALEVTAWVWFALVAFTLVVPVVVGLDGLQRRRVAGNAQRSLATAVRLHAPEFVVYAGRPEEASYQVEMWLPYLKRTGRSFMVITRAEQPAQTLAALTDVPVVCCATVAEVEQVLVPTLTTVFYVNAASANGQMVRYSHLTHVHLGHGDSDKATSSNPLHAMYDKVFSAGPAAIERYAANGVSIPRDRFCLVGRPQLEAVERATVAIGAVDAPTVLYAPTWRGHVEETRLYSLPVGERIVRALLARGARVIFRPHPFNQDFPEDAATVARIDALLQDDRASTGRRHVWGEQATRTMSIFDCFNDSDAMFSDVSSVVSDYLYSGKPIAMYSVGESPATFVTDFPVGRAAYLATANLGNLDDVLDQLLGDDPLADVRADLRRLYLGDFPDEGYADVFVRAALRVIDGVGVRRADTLEDLEDNDLPEDGGLGQHPDHREQDESHLRATEDMVQASATLKPASHLVTNFEPSGSALPRKRVITRGELLAVVPVLTAVSGATTACAGAPLWLPRLLALVTLVVMTWAGQRRLDRPAPTSMGVYLSLRALVAVALLTVTIRAGSEDRTLVWITASALLLLLLPEMWVRRARSVQRLRVLNLKTLNYRQPKPPFHGWMYAMGLAPLWLLLALGLVGWPEWMATAVALEAALAGVLMLTREVQLLRASDRAAGGLRGAIEAYRPEFVVYFAAQTGARYQLGMWMPYLESLGKRFIVVTRFERSNAEIAGITRAPVVLCRTLDSLEETLVPSLRAVFYVNNGLKNTHYVERRELTHVWLNHGDSEKPACFNPVHAIYDKIFTAGQAGVDRYARHGVQISPEKFEIVGRPQVTGIDIAARHVSAVVGPTVLYAPTWIGPYADSQLYSLPVGARIVGALLDRGCTVVFRAHPNNYRYREARECIETIWGVLEEDRERTGRAHRWGPAAEQDMDLKDCFNASDAMISDVSAVVTDYLQSQKPFAMVAVDSNSEQLVETAPVAVASYVLAGDLSNLTQTLDDLLVHDPLAERRAATRTYYLGDFDVEEPAQPFLRAARRVIDAPVQAPTPVRATVNLSR